ncbi:MAG: twin-arginine translocase subunit TatC [Paraprevotella sp.]|nr:twin-arginine translocase subunit TatC [Paraprevotella sp.]
MSSAQTFWEHLDDLRTVLIRIIVSVLVCSVVVFCFKDILFGVVLAPQSSDFVTYKILEWLTGIFVSGVDSMDVLSVRLINTGLAQQFLLHVKVSVGFGCMLASPYILYQLFGFVSPALYDHERKYALRMVVSGSIMFVLGLMFSYFLVFPLTFRFLSTYQISTIVENTVTIESYIDTLIALCFSMGIVFEIPVLCWVMGKIGIISPQLMRGYRRHVCVILLVIGAVITPTSDVFTLLIVSLPMYLLYELSIHIVARTYSR